MNFETIMRIGYILSHLSELKDVTKVYDTVRFNFVIENGLYSVPINVFTLMAFVMGCIIDGIVLTLVIRWIYVHHRTIASMAYATFAVMFLGMTSEELMR